MSKAENYIRDYTKRCSNAVEGCNQDAYYSEGLYQHWLTPDQARKAVEIAKEEMIENICMWLENNISENSYGYYLELTATSISNIDFFNQEALISDLRKAMKDE